MLVEIVGTNLPGSQCGPNDNIHVGIGSKGHAIELVRGDATEARWRVDVRVVTLDDGSLDFRGTFVDGKRGERFIYLNWVSVAPGAPPGSFVMFRRAKLGLTPIDPALVRRVEQAGPPMVLRGVVDLTDDKGLPRCATVKPPAIEWSAAA